MGAKKSLVGGLDEEAAERIRRTSLKVVAAIFLPSFAMLLVYAIDAYFAWDFWSLAAFSALVLLSFFLVRARKIGLGFGILALAVLGYLGLETAAVVAYPLDLSFYLITDYLGIVVLVIAASLLAPPFAPFLVAILGGCLLSFLAISGGPRHAEATIFANTALVAIALQVEAARRLLGDFSKRTEAAKEKAKSEAERALGYGAKLEIALERNEFLLAELNHRVKNNLQIVSSLMALQASGDPGCGDYIEPARRRIAAIALVHEMLRVSEGRDELDFGAYAESLVRACIAETEVSNVLLDCEVESFFVGLKAASPCGLILSELAWNALKHAHPKDGPLRLSLVAKAAGAERFMFSVEDNGQGMEPASWPLPSAGLGLNLVAALVEQTGGKIEFMPNGKGLAVSAPR